MEKNLVSIIVPVYNVGKYLQYCMESLLNQTYSPIEIVLVDDGSVDNTGAICDEYAKEFNNVKVIHSPNEGVSAARNKGLTAATGEYIAFVDGDDWISRNMIEILYQQIKNTSSDLAVCNIKMQKEYCSAENVVYDTINVQVKNTKEYLEEYFLKFGNSCCGKLFRSKTLADKTFKNGLTIGEDMLFLLESLDEIRKIVIVPFDGYNYLQVPDSAMNKRFTQSYMDQIYCWEKAYDTAAKYGKQVQKAIQSIILISSTLVMDKIAMSWNKGQNEENIRYCKKTIRKNLPGMKGLGMNHFLKCCLCMISGRLYILSYRKLKND